MTVQIETTIGEQTDIEFVWAETRIESAATHNTDIEVTVEGTERV